MSQIYSTRFIDNAALSVGDAYTVPAGFTAVLRDVDVAIGVNLGAFEFKLVGTGAAVLWIFDGPSSAGESDQWRGRQVFYEGEAFGFFASGATFSYSACGYLLTNP
jgi:hypothetical protein